jgi:choline dehydrogenase-like flavoprotein
MIYIVGSGPAAVSCATALLDRGAQVTMLDAGLELEADNQRRRAQLAASSPEQWTAEQVEFLKKGVAAETGGIPLKRAYGSDFPYRGNGSFEFRTNGTEVRPSFALGGFSNVWGGAVLPYCDSDLRDWPITVSDLAPHYKAVTGFMPMAIGPSGADGIDRMFPLYAENTTELQHSPQAQEWLAHLARHREQLAEAGIRFGSSRLAVAPNCVYCGLCMYGCPYGLIYNSAATLDQLRQRPGFHYLNGVTVESASEDGERVTLQARRGAERETFCGARAFLACGALSTSAILLRSIGAYDLPRRLLDSQYYLLPLLRRQRTRGAAQSQSHTLAQAFLELGDSKVSPRTVHLQVYTYNELFSAAIQRMLGPAAPLLRRPSTAILERMLLVQGYLPSELSGHIELRLARDNAVELNAVSNAATAGALSAVVRKLRNNWRGLGAIPLATMLRRGTPGRGYHSGGTFPMRRSPAPMEADTLGRLHGHQRIHAVDSSIFPDIPATTITFTVMANAHRIASEVAL